VNPTGERINSCAPWPPWSAPLHRSRAGASHRRRSLACQDSSRTALATTADGVPVHLMAVADGHGGKRYWLSAVGSDLACRIAIGTAAADLAGLELLSGGAGPGERLLAWLSQELPARIVAQWHREVATDWQDRRSKATLDQGFSPYTYGTTLGLVLLTPRWWAHTGIGDWDLVLIDAQDQARIVSEERASAGAGEGTASLCLPDAASLFAERTAVQLLDTPSETIALVLSTDGIRKSCATDGDHLRLCTFLAAEAGAIAAAGGSGESDQLDPSLDRISGEGSGDDVSVAVALRPGPAAALSPMAASARPQRPGPARPLLLLGLLLTTSGLLLAGGLVLWPRIRITTRPVTAPERAAPGREAGRLCRQPALITPTLNQRKALFRRLILRPDEGAAIQRSGDATGALIVASRSDPGQPRPTPVCPALARALQQHWQSAQRSP